MPKFISSYSGFTFFVLSSNCFFISLVELIFNVSPLNELLIAGANNVFIDKGLAVLDSVISVRFTGCTILFSCESNTSSSGSI